MANSEQLRENKKQHRPKNDRSKLEDKDIKKAMFQCIEYLEFRFPELKEDYRLEHTNSVSFGELIAMSKLSGLRYDYDTTFSNRRIIPDGGLIFLTKKDDTRTKKILLVSEVKVQGTNDLRLKEGKAKQAQGNAIERIGKNLIGIRTALNHENITPFVCFGYGCDFEEDYDDSSFVMSKVSMLNEFYYLNKIYVFKKDGDKSKNYFSPVTMYFREEKWSSDEMFEILKEVAETALRYYIY